MGGLGMVMPCRVLPVALWSLLLLSGRFGSRVDAAEADFVVPESDMIEAPVFLADGTLDSIGGIELTEMPAMHEAPGHLGRMECRLRAIDRVLRQHPTDYAAIRNAMEDFKSGTQSAKEHVKQYYGCVLGMTMMLMDCNSMPMGQMMTDQGAIDADNDAKAFLKKEGAPLVGGVVRAIMSDSDSTAFQTYMSKVEKVVCEAPVIDGIIKREGEAQAADKPAQQQESTAPV